MNVICLMVPSRADRCPTPSCGDSSFFEPPRAQSTSTLHIFAATPSDIFTSTPSDLFKVRPSDQLPRWPCASPTIWNWGCELLPSPKPPDVEPKSDRCDVTPIRRSLWWNGSSLREDQCECCRKLISEISREREWHDQIRCDKSEECYLAGMWSGADLWVGQRRCVPTSPESVDGRPPGVRSIEKRSSDGILHCWSASLPSIWWSARDICNDPWWSRDVREMHNSPEQIESWSVRETAKET